MNSDRRKVKGRAESARRKILPGPVLPGTMAGRGAMAAPAAEDGGGGEAEENHRQRSALPANPQHQPRQPVKTRRGIPPGGT